MRTFMKVTASVALAMLTCTSGAQAAQQESAGREISQSDLYAYGYCLAQTKRGLARAVMATFPFSAEAERAARRLAAGECLDSAPMAVTSESLRGPLYQARYRIEFGRAPVPNLATVPVIDYSVGAGQPLDETALAAVNLRKFADCVVRRDSAAARALVMSDPGTPADQQAFDGLKPVMATCVVAGEQVALRRPVLRAVIAEVLYRLTVEQAQATRVEKG